MMSLMSSKTAISSKTREVRTFRLIIFVCRISVDLTNQASKCKVAKVVYKQDLIKKNYSAILKWMASYDDQQLSSSFILMFPKEMSHI